MPLVNGGKIAGDSFVKLAVDTPLPEGGDILVPAERDLVELGTLLLHAENADMADMVMAASVDAAGNLDLQLADVIEDIVEAYLALRERPEELFVDTVKRLGVEPFKERVYATR